MDICIAILLMVEPLSLPRLPNVVKTLSAGLIALCFRLGPKHSLVSRPGPMFRPCPARCRTIWPSETGPVSLSARTPNGLQPFRQGNFPSNKAPAMFLLTSTRLTHPDRARSLSPPFVTSLTHHLVPDSSCKLLTRQLPRRCCFVKGADRTAPLSSSPKRPAERDRPCCRQGPCLLACHDCAHLAISRAHVPPLTPPVFPLPRRMLDLASQCSIHRVNPGHERVACHAIVPVRANGQNGSPIFSLFVSGSLTRNAEYVQLFVL